MTIDATEKLYADFQLSVTNAGGHSSLPRPDNISSSLADGLARLQNYQQQPDRKRSLPLGFIESFGSRHLITKGFGTHWCSLFSLSFRSHSGELFHVLRLTVAIRPVLFGHFNQIYKNIFSPQL
jgi:hypothetical protein